MLNVCGFGNESVVRARDEQTLNPLRQQTDDTSPRIEFEDRLLTSAKFIGLSDCHSQSEEIDKAAVFQHRYDLARELGYCSGQEIREGEQWICLSRGWEQWETVVKQGYGLDYFKKIIKKNKRN